MWSHSGSTVSAKLPSHVSTKQISFLVCVNSLFSKKASFFPEFTQNVYKTKPKTPKLQRALLRFWERRDSDAGCRRRRTSQLAGCHQGQRPKISYPSENVWRWRGDRCSNWNPTYSSPRKQSQKRLEQRVCDCTCMVLKTRVLKSDRAKMKRN